MSKQLLYIGLSGYAGSGKDTVAKILSAVLNFNGNSFKEFKQYYNALKLKENIIKSATFDSIWNENVDNKVVCLAYADQLKYICSAIFGIPVSRFYLNKSNAWIAINKDFEYTEVKPQLIISAEEYAGNIENYTNAKESYYMSLREILVYVGTYVLQADINKRIFVNIVNNTIKDLRLSKKNLEYVIITDNRFEHEINFIKENNGILINIKRSGINQLDNIAEHELDDEDSFDYTIENNGSYDDLLKQVWNLVHNNIEFNNVYYILKTRTHDIVNYIRQVGPNRYKLCTENKVQKISHDNGKITMIDLVGGPIICVNNLLEFQDMSNYFCSVSKIEFDDISNKFFLTLEQADDIKLT